MGEFYTITGHRTPAHVIAARDEAIANRRAGQIAKKQRKTIAKARHRNRQIPVTKTVSDDELDRAFVSYVSSNWHIWEALSDDQQRTFRLNFERYYRGEGSHEEWWASVKLLETELFGAPKERWQIEAEREAEFQRQRRLRPLDRIPGGY